MNARNKRNYYVIGRSICEVRLRRRKRQKYIHVQSKFGSSDTHYAIFCSNFHKGKPHTKRIGFQNIHAYLDFLQELHEQLYTNKTKEFDFSDKITLCAKKRFNDESV